MPRFLSWLERRRSRQSTADELYGAVVTAARNPALYGPRGAPDTPEVRYELIVLHLFLVLDRLAREGPEAGQIARLLAERFVVDMDDCMREMGVGDLTVPKKVRRAAAGLYERSAAYGRAVSGAEPQEAMAAALAEAVPGLARPGALALYVIEAHRALAGVARERVLSGAIAFELPSRAATAME